MGIKPLLLSLLGVSALGGVAVGGYYAFNKNKEKEQTTDNKPKATQEGTENSQTQTPREEGTVAGAPTTPTRTDTTSSASNTGSSGSSSTTISPSNPSPQASVVSPQPLPSR